jgi:FkbM family methyltransferase
MQQNSFEFLGRHIELWTHPDPDHQARAIRSNRTFYELDLLMKCQELYLPGTAIIDVGANIGNYSVFFGAILNAPVYAFEPFQPNRALLEINIAANRLSGQIVAPCCALGEVVGVGSLQPDPPPHFGTARMSFGFGDTMVRSLDSLAIPGPIGLIKIDVEGAEVSVLRGAEGLIHAWLPDVLAAAGTREAFWRLADVLARYGYAPRGRYAKSATYLFSAMDQLRRMEHITEDLYQNRGWGV